MPEHTEVLRPLKLSNPETDRLAVATLQGRLLIFPMGEIPVLNKGKGNKLIDIKVADVEAGTDRIVALATLPPGSWLKILAGKRLLTLQGGDLAVYEASRAKRYHHLPRGFQRVDGMEGVS